MDRFLEVQNVIKRWQSFKYTTSAVKYKSMRVRKKGGASKRERERERERESYPDGYSEPSLLLDMINKSVCRLEAPCCSNELLYNV